MVKLFLILISAFFLFYYFPGFVLAARSQPLIANHEAVIEFNRLADPTKSTPAERNEWQSYINKAKNDFRVTYGHTSHGSQVVTGMNLLDEGGLGNYNGGTYDAFDDFAHYRWGGGGNPVAPSGTLSFFDQKMSGASDLGNPGWVEWEAATRSHLDNYGSSRNTVMWSWCGQVSGASEANINTYLSLMNGLEDDYGSVNFIYMTGHLDGSGDNGNLNQRNNQIRNYVRDSSSEINTDPDIIENKILFDFADIETWSPPELGHPDGVRQPNDTDACGWCSDWCDNHSCPSCSCAHSHCLNCYNKGKAFWWLMAKLAGWGASSTPTPTTPPPGDCTPGDSDDNGSINVADLKFVLNRYYGNFGGTCVDQQGDGLINGFDLARVLFKLF